MAKNIDGLVLNGQSYDFTVTDTNLAGIETDRGTASKAYAVGDHLILDGQYYVVIAPIAENDGLVVGTNIDVATVGAEITGLRNSFSKALTDLKATPIAQAVGAVGTTFASVIVKLGEIVNRGKWTANMANTGSVTIPAGYHDGTGSVSTSGTASITTNGTHNIAQYSKVNVNVQHNEYSEILSTISVDGSGANQAGVIRQIYNNHTVSGIGIYRASSSTGGINPGFCFSIRYSGGRWTVTLNRNCIVNNAWYGAGATISWAYNAWQNLVFIPA